MHRRSRQSELLIPPPSTAFHPTTEYSRLSFLDLLGEDERTPLDRLEPAYVDGATLVAVWPQSGPLEEVAVLTWAPDLRTLEELQWLQVDWPPAMCDLMVRVDAHGLSILRPCGTSTARRAQLERGSIAESVRHAMDRGARLLGRGTNLGR